MNPNSTPPEGSTGPQGAQQAAEAVRDVGGRHGVGARGEWPDAAGRMFEPCPNDNPCPLADAEPPLTAV